MSQWYKWWQPTGEEEWNLILADHEADLIAKKKPAFVTILAADNPFKGQMTAEDIWKVRYTGPLYFDFDAPSLEEATEQVQRFLEKLETTCEFNLNQGQYFASGGKGYHVLIPQECFIPKVNPKGYLNLPAIYKEIAMEVYVDTLDLNVYSARRGRQFRVANVERPDKPGIYKVPLTADDVMTMTVERYKRLITEPRFVPPPEAPTICTPLAVMFATNYDKVEAATKNRKTAQVDVEMLKRFGGDVPPSIKSLMDGEHVKDGAGFQKIATQLSIFAHAFGIPEERFLDQCAGLIANHKSDGNRYNTPEKRRRELSRMYGYMHENPCYQFSTGGIKSLLADGYKADDLDSNGVEFSEEEQETKDDLEYALTGGLRITPHGMYRNTDEGIRKVSALGITHPRQLVDVDSGQVLGYEVDITVDGRPRGRRVLDMGMFLSRTKFCQFTLSAGGSNVNITDAQAGALADILRTRATKSGDIVYTVGKEGLDVVPMPDGKLDLVWADTEGVLSKAGRPYRLMGIFSEGHDYKTDLRKAPNLRSLASLEGINLEEAHVLPADQKAEEYFHKLFSINTTEVIGKMFGWYSAAFISQIIRHVNNRQFPMLQVYGPAGSGKTQTTLLLSRMHYWRRVPHMTSAMEATPFTMETLVSGSASIPCIFDEVKPREMSRDRLNKLRMLMRGNYTGTDIAKGRVSGETGQSRLDIRRASNSAPLVFIGEAMESQSAIEERCVIVAVNKEGKRGHKIDFTHCSTHHEYLGAFGRSLLDRSMNLSLKTLRPAFLEQQQFLYDRWGEYMDDNDRPASNITTVLLGLEHSRRMFNELFGSTFDSKIDEMKEAVCSIAETAAQTTMSEVAKVLDTLAYMSTLSDENGDLARYRLKYGVDYVVDRSREMVELNVRNVFTLYMMYTASVKAEALFDDYTAFRVGLTQYTGMIDKFCPHSVMRQRGSNPTLLGFSIRKMALDGVNEFHVPRD